MKLVLFLALLSLSAMANENGYRASLDEEKKCDKKEARTKEAQEREPAQVEEAPEISIHVLEDRDD